MFVLKNNVKLDKIKYDMNTKEGRIKMPTTKKRKRKSRIHKKGFTLIEILAAITILGILMGIAIVSVTKIIEDGKQEHYDTAEENLSLAGQSYVQQNRGDLPKAVGQKKKISLKTLVENRYIQPIKDYSDNECNLEESYVQVYKYSQTDYSYVPYLDCPGYTSEDTINNITPEISAQIHVDDDKGTVTGRITLTGNDKLMSYSYIVYRGSKEVKNTGNVIVSDFKESLSLTIPLTEYTPGNLKLYVTATNTYGQTKSVTVTKNVADQKPPQCIYLDSADEADKDWTSENRKITVGCDDGDGSGCTRETFTKTFKTTTEYGYITIKDESGNETNCPVSVFVDKTAPECTRSGDSKTWTNSDRTITWGCKDKDSGCNVSFSGGTTTFSTTTKTATIAEYIIKDNVGNETTCAARTANIYVDKTPPTCKVSGGNSNWTTGNRTIKAECTDSNSGCATEDFSKTYSSDINTATAGAKDNNNGGTVKDNAGNVTNCDANQTVKIDKTKPVVSSVSNPKEGVATIPGLQVTLTGADQGTVQSGLSKWQYKEGSGSWIDLTNSNYSPYVDTYTALRDSTVFSYRLCDVAGNCSEAKNTTVKIVNACSSTTTTWSGTWSTCSKKCGTGTQTMTGTKYSTYDGSNCGTDTKTQNCNTEECCSSTTTTWSGTWGTCSKKCDTGTQTMTGTKYSTYDSSVSCGSDSKSQNCNTQACCSSTTTTWSGTWSTCSATCGGGTQTMSGTKYSTYDSSVSCGSDSKSQECNTNTCGPPSHTHKTGALGTTLKSCNWTLSCGTYHPKAYWAYCGVCWNYGVIYRSTTSKYCPGKNLDGCKNWATLYPTVVPD